MIHSIAVGPDPARTAEAIAQYRRNKLALPRRRIPAFRWPRLLEVEYGSQIAKIVDVQDEIAPLLAELPALLDRSSRARGLRQDEAGGESRKARDLLDRARRLLDRSMTGFHLDQLTEKMGRRISAHQRAELRRQTQAALGIDLVAIDKGADIIIREFSVHNVSLIRSLGNRTLDDVSKIVANAFVRGRRAEDVVRDIAERYQISDRHARLIARDQIGTLTGQITAARHREIGITRFRWRSVNDQRVRPEHRVLDGQEFAYNKPPGEGLPGEPINCRCFQEPVFDELVDSPATPRSPMATRVRRPRSPMATRVRRPRAATIAPPAQLESPADRSLRAMAEADVHGSRQALEAHFSAVGDAQRITATPTTTIAKLPRHIAGDYSISTGNIRITSRTATRSRQFARAWRKDPAAARSAIQRHQRLIDEYVAGRSGMPDLNSADARLFDQATHYQTLVHEVLHGFGRAPEIRVKDGYALRIEEVATEAAARKHMEMFGLRMRGDPGSQIKYGYEAWLHQTARGISESSGSGADTSWKAMLDAASDAKSNSSKDANPEESFAVSVHRRLGSPTWVSPERIKQAVRKSWATPI